jgi:hypothetical protein
MWTFLVELAAVEDQVAGNLYPETLFSHGEMPDEADGKIALIMQMILKRI